MRNRRPLASPFGALALCAGLVACGEEGKTIGDSCQDVPLFRFGYDSASNTWKRFALDGGALSDAENARIEEEQSRAGRRCLSPLGTAISSSTGGVPGNGGTSSVTGGTSSVTGGTSSVTGGTSSASGGAGGASPATGGAGPTDGGSADGG